MELTGFDEGSVADGVDRSVDMWAVVDACVVSLRELVCGEWS